MASRIPQLSLQTAPQRGAPPTSIRTSTRPSAGSLPPANLTWDTEDVERERRKHSQTTSYFIYCLFGLFVLYFLYYVGVKKRAFSQWSLRLWSEHGIELRHPGCACSSWEGPHDVDTVWWRFLCQCTAPCSYGWDQYLHTPQIVFQWYPC